MKVLELVAHNVMRLSDVTLDMSGHHLFLVGGKNGHGKSSTLKSVLIALCGRSGCDYPEPALKKGEDEGWVRIKLSGDESIHQPEGIVVELHLKRRRDGSVAEQFRILDASGDEAPEPRKLLKRLYEAKAFDPLAFDRMPKKDRRETLMKLIGLDLEGFKAKHREIYNKRTLVNAEGVKLKGRFEAFPFHKDVPAVPESVGDLMTELKESQDHNAAITLCEKSIINAKNMIEERDLEVKRLKQQLIEAKEFQSQSVQYLSCIKQELACLGDERKTELIADRIKAAGDVNAKIQANATRAEVEVELQRLRDESSELSDALKALADEQDKALTEAAWPIPGMSVDDEGVLLDGLPFESACKSKRVLSSVNVGIALNPTLRLLICEDGSDLDTETLAVLDETLKANDFQALIELVTRTEADEQMCAVVIRDGAVAE